MIKIYTSPSCSSCRKVKKWFDEQNIPYTEKNIFNGNLKEEELRAILEKTENGTEDIIATKSKIMKENKVNFDDMSISEMINEQQFLDMKNKNLFPIGEVNSYLQNKNISTNDLYIFANAKTERIDIHYHTSLISIDKTTVLDHIDYEIECENTNIKKAKDDIISFLDQFSIKYKENKTSKLKRVLSLI